MRPLLKNLDLNFTKNIKMKLLAVFAALSMAQDTPHDPEAQAFCEGKQEGYYANPKDCGSYFFCWNQGNILDGLNIR